jgi:hypothetical protein
MTMKRIVLKAIVPFTIFGAGLASAQNTQNLNGVVQHVIVVIQENRTPDNLFREDSVLVANGADLVPSSQALQHACNNGPVTQAPYMLNTCFDPDHGHDWVYEGYHHDAWVKTYHAGAMDGACDVTLWCGAHPHPCNKNDSCPLPTNAQYTYVDNTIWTPGIVQPYFDIANQYGFANYLFQTNQGPSFEAHQFLFSGTSAPDDPSDQNDATCAPLCHTWFSAENQNAYGLYGCISGYGSNGHASNIVEVSPAAPVGQVESLNIYNNGYPCYHHNSLADLLDKNKVNNNPLTWRYYPQGNDPPTKPASTSLWTAPNAIYNVCQPGNGTQPGDVCLGPDWLNNVAPEIPPYPAKQGEMAPILTDIQSCSLPNVSWVIPDGAWSDHAGGTSTIYGPSWVAAIVNAVGTSNCENGNGYWKDTVILVVWDDWGGWYDHVAPWNSSNGGGYSNGTGSSYVYGFRVPLLVVSAYSKHTSGQPGFTGYISGACQSPGNCNNEVAPYVHDFGSILNFIEYAFGTNGNFLSLPGYPPNSGISPLYAYADVLAPDVYLNGGCSQSTCPYSLSDFFNPNWNNPTTFATINAPFGASTFENWGYNDGNQPSDPDDDEMEQP